MQHLNCVPPHIELCHKPVTHINCMMKCIFILQRGASGRAKIWDVYFYSVVIREFSISNSNEQRIPPDFIMIVYYDFYIANDKRSRMHLQWRNGGGGKMAPGPYPPPPPPPSGPTKLPGKMNCSCLVGIHP